MDDQKEDKIYQVLVDKVFERCQEIQLENERLVFRTNKVKKLVQRCNRDIELLKRRLDRYNDNWRSLPMVLPHPKRKIEQKRGPKPKSKQGTPNIINTPTNIQNVQKSENVGTTSSAETGKKVRKQRIRKTDKEAPLNQQEATLLRQQQQQKRQEMQKQRQREQQALKLAAQQQRQLLRQQKQMAAQHLKQQRQLQRQQQRANNQQQKKISSNTIGTASPNSPPGRFVTKVSTTFLTPQRSTNPINAQAQSIIGDDIMPPPPPPPKVDALYTDQQAQLLLMHRPLQITTLKNQQQIPKTP